MNLAPSGFQVVELSEESLSWAFDYSCIIQMVVFHWNVDEFKDLAWNFWKLPIVSYETWHAYIICEKNVRLCLLGNFSSNWSPKSSSFRGQDGLPRIETRKVCVNVQMNNPYYQLFVFFFPDSWSGSCCSLIFRSQVQVLWTDSGETLPGSFFWVPSCK